MQPLLQKRVTLHDDALHSSSQEWLQIMGDIL